MSGKGTHIAEAFARASCYFCDMLRAVPLVLGVSLALTLPALISACSTGKKRSADDGDFGAGDDIKPPSGLTGDGDTNDPEIDWTDEDKDKDGDPMDPEYVWSTDCGAEIDLIVRDFNTDHPDFEEEYPGRDDAACGVVESQLFIGTDGARTPVFVAPNGTGQRTIEDGVISCAPWDERGGEPKELEFSGEEGFNQWFSDVDGVNSTFTVTLKLEPMGDPADPKTKYVYDSLDQPGDGFFIADGKGFNEQTATHNFHFTTEAHVTFKYEGGEEFTFSGDDDMWIFVNGKLALDLGGLHNRLEATIDFDAQAEELGLVPGSIYNMDIFHAERHTYASNYRVETNIQCFKKVEVPTEIIR